MLFTTLMLQIPLLFSQVLLLRNYIFRCIIWFAEKLRAWVAQPWINRLLNKFWPGKISRLSQTYGVRMMQKVGQRKFCARNYSRQGQTFDMSTHLLWFFALRRFQNASARRQLSWVVGLGFRIVMSQWWAVSCWIDWSNRWVRRSQELNKCIQSINLTSTHIVANHPNI